MLKIYSLKSKNLTGFLSQVKSRTGITVQYFAMSEQYIAPYLAWRQRLPHQQDLKLLTKT